MLEARLKRPIPSSHAPTRLGDQPVFYCNVDRAARELDWKPRVVAGGRRRPSARLDPAATATRSPASSTAQGHAGAVRELRPA